MRISGSFVFPEFVHEEFFGGLQGDLTVLSRLTVYTGPVIWTQVSENFNKGYGIYCGSRDPSAAIAYTAVGISVVLTRVALGNEQPVVWMNSRRIPRSLAQHITARAVRQFDVANNGRQERTRLLGQPIMENPNPRMCQRSGNL